MGTRSTVKFKANDKVVLSVYQQYDGYMEGVGVQVARTLKRWKVEGVKTSHYNDYLKKEVERHDFANGIYDLALLYVVDNKKGAMNMYVCGENQTEEFNYEISYIDDLGVTVDVYQEIWLDEVVDEPITQKKIIYTGMMVDFIAHIEELIGEEL